MLKVLNKILAPKQNTSCGDCAKREKYTLLNAAADTLRGDFATGAGSVYQRLHADIHSLADVPAGLFIDMMGWMVTRDAWGPGGPRIAGASVDLAGLRALPVLTIEAGEDELIGRGQTHILPRRVPVGAAQAATLPGEHRLTRETATLRGLSEPVAFVRLAVNSAA